MDIYENYDGHSYANVQAQGEPGTEDFRHGMEYTDYLNFLWETTEPEDQALLFDLEGEDLEGVPWLNREAEAELQMLISEHFSRAFGDTFSVYVENNGGDDAHVTFSVGKTELSDGFIEDPLGEYWDSYAELINITDPGTFDSIYLYGKLIERLQAKHKN